MIFLNNFWRAKEMLSVLYKHRLYPSDIRLESVTQDEVSMYDVIQNW